MLAPRAVKRKNDNSETNGASTTAVTENASDGSSSVEAPASKKIKIDGSEAASEPVTDGANQTEATEEVSATGANVTNAPEVKDGQEAAAKVEKVDKEEAKRLALLKWQIEECFSDWALSCQHPELFRKIGLSMDGYVHISNLLTLPPIAELTSTLSDITKALQAAPSDVLKLDETGFQVMRLQPVDLDALDRMTAKEWSTKTLYLENIPSTSSLSKGYTMESLKVFLEDLLESPIVTLRLPQLYVPPSTSDHEKGHQGKHPDDRNKRSNRKGKERADVEIDEADETPAQKARRERTYALPLNGGPFKGFAFVVLQDQEKATAALERWHWNKRGQRRDVVTEEEESEGEEADGDEEDIEAEVDGEDEEADNGHEASDNDAEHRSEAAENSAEDAPDTVQEVDQSSGPFTADELKAGSSTKAEKPQLTIQQKADLAGFTVMPITTFNALKSEYLAYHRDITLLVEKHEQNNSFGYNRQRRRSESPPQFTSNSHSSQKSQGKGSKAANNSKRKRSPSPARWERKAPSPTSDRWERKPLSPSPERPVRRFDATEDECPRGCVVFLKRFHPKANLKTLRTLFQNVLETEELDTEKLSYLDHVRNVDSCHIRFADASTASFFASYFSSSSKRYLHTDAEATDPSEAFSTAPAGEKRCIEAEVISGTPEIIYWTKVPLSARKAYSQGKKTVAGDESEQEVAADAASEAAEAENDDSENRASINRQEASGDLPMQADAES